MSCGDEVRGLEERRLALEELKAQREYELRKLEIELKGKESGWLSKFASPLTTTILAGVLTLAGSVVGSLVQGQNTLQLEREKFQASEKIEQSKFDTSRRLESLKQQHELILKMISVGDERQARSNIRFLAENGLIADQELARKLLESKTIGVLPSSSATPPTDIGSPKAVYTDDEIIDKILKWEGGLVSVPADPGGAVNGGISANMLSKFLGRNVGAEEIRKLSQDDIKNYYREVHFKGGGMDQIQNSQVKAAYVNVAVLGGPSNAAKAFSGAVGKILGKDLPSDGILGKGLISLINSSPDP